MVDTIEQLKMMLLRGRAARGIPIPLEMEGFNGVPRGQFSGQQGFNTPEPMPAYGKPRAPLRQGFTPPPPTPFYDPTSVNPWAPVPQQFPNTQGATWAQPGIAPTPTPAFDPLDSVDPNPMASATAGQPAASGSMPTGPHIMPDGTPMGGATSGYGTTGLPGGEGGPDIAGSRVDPKFGGLNNPGNIRVTKDPWVGKTPVIEGQQFESFSDPSFGYRAMIKNMQSYRKAGITDINGMVDKWLSVDPNKPSTDNPAAYKAAIQQYAGLKPGDPIPFDDPDKMNGLLRAMTIVEKGSDVYGDKARIEGMKLVGATTPVGSATTTQTTGKAPGKAPVETATAGPTMETTIPVGGAQPTTGTTPPNEPVTAGRRDTVGGVPSSEMTNKGWGAFFEKMSPAFLKAAGGFLQPGPQALGKGFTGLGEGMQEQRVQDLRERQQTSAETVQKAQIDQIRAGIARGKLTHLGHGILYNQDTGKTIKVPEVLQAELGILDRRMDAALARAGMAGGKFTPIQFMAPDGKTVIPGIFDRGTGKYTTMDGQPPPADYRVVNPSAGISEGEKRGATLGKEDAEMEVLADKAYTQHRPTIARIERMEKVAPGQAGQTVWSQGARLIADKLGIPIGDFNPKDINEAKLFFNQAKLKAGEYFKGQGQVSNFERQMLNDAIATLESNPDNLRVALGQMKLAEQYAKTKHDAWLAAKDAGAKSYRSFSTKYDQQNQDNWVERSKALYDQPKPADGTGVTPGGFKFKRVQ